MIKFHAQLREGVIKSGNEKSLYDAKWGRFAPNRRFNVDQEPMAFIVDQKKTNDINIQKTDRRDYRTWVSQPRPGQCIRQYTLQVCISPESKVRLAVIFCGKGKRISPDEKESYHKYVDVYWQPNAWGDTKFSIEWVRKTLKSADKTDNNEEFILFCDNLTAQTGELFCAEVKSINGLVWYGASEARDIWQPVDCGIGQTLKRALQAYKRSGWATMTTLTYGWETLKENWMLKREGF